MSTFASASVKEKVRKQYTLAVTGPNGRLRRETKAFRLTQIGYNPIELSRVPEDAILHTYPCGNPVAYSSMTPGDVIVDIGSGVGLDCLIAAERLGAQDRVIGFDLTPAMVERASENAKVAGKHNIEFRVGEAEALPLEDETADCVISNGAMCLAPDKERAFREAFRILRPGGRLSVSDLLYALPRPLQQLSLYLSGISAETSEERYVATVSLAGFVEVRVEARQTYSIEQAATLWGIHKALGRLAQWGCHPLLRPFANQILKRVTSIQLTARKPQGRRLLAPL